MSTASDGARVHKIEFSIATVDVISANGREHHMTKARKTKTVRQLAWATAFRITQHRSIPLVDRAHVTVSIGWQPLKRTRDADNLAPTVKAAIDGFVDAGVFSNDDDKHRLSTTYTTYPRSEAGRVWLRFEIEEAA